MKKDHLCTPKEREQILNSLLDALKKDNRSAGVALVGSGAIGFEDTFSDIDLSVVVESSNNIENVFQYWVTQFKQTLHPIGYFETRYANDNLLWGFLLPNFLEIDMGFLGLGNLVARSERWKVIFDNTGRIEEILHRTWENRPPVDIRGKYLENFNGIWHYITHVAILVERGQLLRAIHYLNELRDDTVEIIGLRHGLRTRNWRDVDIFPAKVRRKLNETMVTNMEKPEILRALKVTTKLFFEEAEILDKALRVDSAKLLKKNMLVYLSHFDS